MSNRKSNKQVFLKTTANCASTSYYGAILDLLMCSFKLRMDHKLRGDLINLNS